MKGHQPFFLGAALFATLAIGAWTAMLSGMLPAGEDPVRWHAHEMLFGYTIGVLAGFLLIGTTGWRLLGLATLWAAGRIALAAGMPAVPAASSTSPSHRRWRCFGRRGCGAAGNGRPSASCRC